MKIEDRRYIVIAIYERTGGRVVLSSENEPMTYQEACTFKGKCLDYPGRTVMLEEV